jgi:hypothetical protein
MNKARVESFSDGVFAFAITLLVLGILIPNLARVGQFSNAFATDLCLATARGRRNALMSLNVGSLPENQNECSAGDSGA